MDNYSEFCPYCGGKWNISTTHNGHEEWKCQNCGHSTIIKSEDDKTQMYEMGLCVDKMIAFVHRRRSRRMADKIKEWEKWQKEFSIEQYIQKYSGKLGENPLFAMAEIANLTYGFQTYESIGSENTKETVESLYETASKYLNANPNATKLAELVSLYNKKLIKKSKSRAKVILITCGVAIAACFIGAIVGLTIYSPYVKDVNSGVSIDIPNDSVSIFQKLNIDAEIEQQPQNATAYVDAKNALRNETEKFELYDISLKSGSNKLNFDGNVIVNIPIPSGYDTSALKVFYVSSDEVYEEILFMLNGRRR